MDGQTKAILAHVPVIGWLIAIMLNQGASRSEFASFYIRQSLGIVLLAMAIGCIPILNIVLWIIPVAFWFMSFIYAIQNTTREVPVLGAYFQNWFRVL